MIVREAQSNDQAGIADVFGSYDDPTRVSTVAALWEVWSADPMNRPLVAADSDVGIIGFVNLGVHRDREGWIEDLVVHHAFQGRGIATALVGRCREIIDGLGGNRLGLDVFSNNARAISLYTRLGFEAVHDYVRMDGAVTPDVIDRAAAFLDQHRDILVSGYRPTDRSAVCNLLSAHLRKVHQRVVRDHHKAYVFDRADLEEEFVGSGCMLVARADVNGPPLGIALVQVARVWQDGDRVIPLTSLLVARYPDLPTILISCAIVIAPPGGSAYAAGRIREYLVSSLLIHAADAGIRGMRAYPQVGDVFTIDCLRRSDLSLPLWERDPERSFLVMGNTWI